jgi:hypothetical protein
VTHGHSAKEDDAQADDAEVDRPQDVVAEAFDGGQEGGRDAEAEDDREVARRQEGSGDAQAEGNVAQVHSAQADDRSPEADDPEVHVAQADHRQANHGGPQAEEADHRSEVLDQAHHREAQVAPRARSSTEGGHVGPPPRILGLRVTEGAA